MQVSFNPDQFDIQQCPDQDSLDPQPPTVQITSQQFCELLQNQYDEILRRGLHQKRDWLEKRKKEAEVGCDSAKDRYNVLKKKISDSLYAKISR